MTDRPIPLADEIKEARRLSQEAQKAALHLQKLASALQSVAILKSTARMQGGEFEGPIPGDEALNEILSAWPSLAPLADQGPDPEDSYLDRLTARLTQLKATEQHLTPIAGEASVRNNTLARLQHEQQVALAEPEWVDVVDQLGELGIARDTAARELAPLNQRISMLEPAMNLLRTHLGAIKKELQRAKTLDDPQASQAYLTVRMSANLVEALGDLLAHVKLEIPLPDAPELGDSPDPDKRRWYWKEVTRVSGELRDLLSVLKEEGGALRAEADEVSKRYEGLTAQLLERMG